MVAMDLIPANTSPRIHNWISHEWEWINWRLILASDEISGRQDADNVPTATLSSDDGICHHNIG